MGFQDRRYDNEPSMYDKAYGGGGGRGFGGGGMRLAFDYPRPRSVSFWLIIINVAIFVIAGFPAAWLDMPVIQNLLFFSMDKALYQGQVWRFISYQYAHAGVGHLFFNMLTLFFFGPMIERYWGSLRYLAFYTLCGIGGACLYLIGVPTLGAISNAMNVNTPMVGASGCLFGLIVCAGIRFGHVMLFGIIPMKIAAWVFLGISVISVLTSSGEGSNLGGELAHLGGAGVGILLSFFPAILGFADERLWKGIAEKQQEKARVKQVQVEQNKEAELDRILSKVSEQGLHSLTAKEKKVLQRSTEEKRKSS